MFEWEWAYPAWLGLIGLLCFYLIGILHILHALMNTRTSQGTIAWVISLLTFPFLTIPLYWLLGRSKFSGYIRARRDGDANLKKQADEMHRSLRHFTVEIPDDDVFEKAAEILGGLPFTRGNELELLIDGEETFERIFETVAAAERCILVNFFIVKNDQVGKRFQQALIARAKAGIKVLFLFDEIGSHKLSSTYLGELRDAGVRAEPFGTNRHWWSRLQLNFRNHRKILITDGTTAFIGGLNVGDEYMGRDEKFGKWRDTHLQLKGPSVQAIQTVFLEDWYWATQETPDLKWTAHAENADQIAGIIPTGPADPADSWKLLVAEAANSARERLWIASPYFVPDDGVITALQLAALRGADVRILLPDRPDHILVWLSTYTYYEQSIPYGVKLYRYTRGFMHQKVMLVDERMAMVGTANLDNRSFRLNFEITAFVPDKSFIDEVAHVLAIDFEQSIEVKLEEFTAKPFLFRAACRAARLLAPIQ